ncbi:MAG: hypothetical protein DMG35_11330 [Acidobacteria bacterium]|nr:MAG: hypothetical protein AUH86_02270 [Acidobacteria bacterium 13_1_40CM_4_58_4]PYT60349.1 MAG: hypothetical protein DMG35_11330 [Acidobacteriota bacterium]
MEALLDGDVEPAKNFQWIQPVNGCEGVQLVQARHNSPVFDVCQPANVEDKIGTATAGCQFIAGPFHISIS